VGKRHVGDVLHDQEIDTIPGVEIGHCLDVGMVEPRQSEGFFAKAFAALFSQGARREDFEGDIAVQALVMGTVHHTHAAGPDLLKDAVMR
jgi:hypothetical protein